MNDVLMSFVDVEKTYTSGLSTLTILEHLYLDVVEGESIAITGKSGCGKSTLLNLAGGLDRATQGEIYFKGTPLSSFNDKKLSHFRNGHIGFVFQSHILLEDFTALENICIPSIIRGESKRSVIKRAYMLLERVELLDRMAHHPQKLSGGERQRVAICRALINSPDIIIADEPTGSLDEESSSSIESLLFDIVQEENKTLLLVTHDTSLASRCSKIFTLTHRSLEEKL
ncbi:MAG: ABC transporter ATP-binding protein [Spirochaetia bacterium]|nr:ABC transporter ATP-binding protein [Spirochaetia bacterium]